VFTSWKTVSQLRNLTRILWVKLNAFWRENLSVWRLRLAVFDDAVFCKVEDNFIFKYCFALDNQNVLRTVAYISKVKLYKAIAFCLFCSLLYLIQHRTEIRDRWMATVRVCEVRIKSIVVSILKYCVQLQTGLRGLRRLTFSYFKWTEILLSYKDARK